MKTATDLQLAELLAAISMATDLQHGYPLEKGLQRTLLAASGWPASWDWTDKICPTVDRP